MKAAGGKLPGERPGPVFPGYPTWL
jgi:hypothetical protein